MVLLFEVISNSSVLTSCDANLLPKMAIKNFRVNNCSPDRVKNGVLKFNQAPPFVNILSSQPLIADMSQKVFWLRCEKKEFERRAALTPTTSKKLIESGFEILVERDEQRIFDDSEYEA